MGYLALPSGMEAALMPGLTQGLPGMLSGGFGGDDAMILGDDEDLVCVSGPPPKRSHG